MLSEDHGATLEALRFLRAMDDPLGLLERCLRTSMVDPLAYEERYQGNKQDAAVNGLYATFHPHTLADAAKLISSLQEKCIAPDITVQDKGGDWISPNAIDLSQLPAVAIEAWCSHDRASPHVARASSLPQEDNPRATSNSSSDSHRNVVLLSDRRKRSLRPKIPGPWEPFTVHPDLPSTQLAPTLLDALGLPRTSPFSLLQRARAWTGIPPAFWHPMLDMAPRLFAESPGDILLDADLSSQEGFAQLVRIVGLVLMQAPEQCPAGYLKLHLEWIQMHLEDSPCWASVEKTINGFDTSTSDVAAAREYPSR